MNEIKTDINGGFRLDLADIRFLDATYRGRKGGAEG